MADSLGSPISAETLENLQRIILGSTPSSCTAIGEWLDFSCRTAAGAIQATLHTRTVTVLWCCSNPDPSGGGDCAPCDGLAKDGGCVKVYEYGSWRDTGQPCGGGIGAGGIESMERAELKPIPEPGDPPLVMARAGGAAGAARVRKAGTRARAPAGRQGRTAR